VKGGKVLFPFVGLGLTLQASAVKIRENQAGAMPRPESVKGPGPTAPGQTVVFRLSLLSKEVLLTGRILLPSGKPAARATLRWTLATKKEGSSSSSSSNLRTDEQGRFRFTLEEGKFYGGTRTLSFLLSQGKEGKLLEAKVDLSRDFYPGENDLGDIRLGELPLLLAGKVVDPKGKPIQGALVLVREKRSFGPDEKLSFWVPLSGSPARTDKEGKFAIAEKSESSQLKVTAMKDGFAPAEWVPATPGEEDLILALRKGGSVKASFLVEPGFPLGDLQISLSLSGSEGKKGAMASMQIQGNQAVWTSVPPGTYDMKITLPTEGDPLVEIPGILVEAGKETRDPRLKEIDLRGKVRVLDLELFGPKGERIRNAMIYLDEKGSRFTRFRPGRPLLLRPGKSRTLLIWTSRYKPKKVPVTGRKMKVVLEDGYKIRLIYTGEAPLPEAPFSLGVDLHPIFDRGGRNHMLSFDRTSFLYFRKDGTAEGRVPLPGKYHVSWMIKKTEGSGWSSRGFSAPDPPELEVRDIPGVQTFQVSLPADALEKALKRAAGG